MKRVIILLSIALLVFAIAGCNDSKEEASPGIIYYPLNLPTEASRPEALTIEELVNHTNSLIGEREDGLYKFDMSKAVVSPPFEDNNEVVYIFTIDMNFEVVLFSDADSGGFRSCYFKLMYSDEFSAYDMAYVVGVFLQILEPNEYTSMLDAVYEDGFFNALEGEINERRVGAGEVWEVLYFADTTMINPK